MPTRRKPLPIADAFLVTLALLAGSPSGLSAADERATHGEGSPVPVATVLGGMKDFDVGVQGEYYLGRGRFSLLAGVGYVLPDPDEDRLPEGASLSAGGRIFTSGLRNRGFLELSYGPLVRGFTLRQDQSVDPAMIYGPSLLLGYQRVAKSRLTLLAAGGVGYARWAEADETYVSFELRLGVGYTWPARGAGPRAAARARSPSFSWLMP